MYDVFLDWLLSVIDSLPSVDHFTVPAAVYDGIDNMVSLLGYYMPYYLYQPLITFILSLTAFRIVYAIYMQIKK